MAELKYDKKTGRLLFTKQMKREYTILMPNMAPIHFRMLKDVFVHYGYKAELLETTTTIPAILRCWSSDSLSTRCKAENTTCIKPR